MKIKVSDYIAQYLVNRGITHGFTVTGGGAMHLNDSFGHQEGLQMIYNHHEQACAIAAEGYARIHNRPALLCVTTGPGGINALNGVAGAYLDSIPMIVISGQVRYDTTVRSTGLPLRSFGDQEFDICRAVECMTKYCEMVVHPLKIRYCLEKALYLASTGRPGPCWLDIPLNVQGAYVELEELERQPGFEPDQKEMPQTQPLTEELADEILERLMRAKRPVIYGGNGIRLSGAYGVFETFVRALGIPVATCWDSVDLMATDDPLYVGRGGIMGDRAGNFAVQNSDVLFTIGNRLSIRQVGYNHESWAREAYVIMNDIDPAELQKPNLHVNLPVCADAGELMRLLLSRIQVMKPDNTVHGEWVRQCNEWKAKYPVVCQKHYEEKTPVNVYAFIHELSRRLPEGRTTVVGNGSACVVGSAAYVIRKRQRFIINSAIASMGYDLPAAIGACVAQNREEIICITGDGSIQMNLQELQTIIHHRFPIKIFLINNQGYHSIRQTQNNFFQGNVVGIGEESRDLSFPSMEKLAAAYGYPYMRINNLSQIISLDSKENVLEQCLSMEGPVICEVCVSTTQKFEPKSATKRLEDGTLVSAPLEDLAPFLPKEELKANMFIPMVDEVS